MDKPEELLCKRELLEAMAADTMNEPRQERALAALGHPPLVSVGGIVPKGRFPHPDPIMRARGACLRGIPFEGQVTKAQAEYFVGDREWPCKRCGCPHVVPRGLCLVCTRETEEA